MEKMAGKGFSRIIATSLVFTMFTFLVADTAKAAVPGATTGLTAVAGNGQVALTWTPVSATPNVTTYNIDYSENTLVWNRVVRTASAADNYNVSGLKNGTTYYFQISAVNNDGVGPISAYVSATPATNYSPADVASFSACPTAEIPSAAFSDVTSTDVDCIKYYGITKGTTATTYSPLDFVKRWQMALFLTRMASQTGVNLGDGSYQGFSDISGKSAEIQTAINQLKQLGITVGKTATTFAPDDNVTRGEMALFIERLLKRSTIGPGGNEEFVSGLAGPKEIKSNFNVSNFTDISNGTYEMRDAIQNLWNLGVTDLQTSTTYEPNVDMTRNSMATFMANAMAHTNARPKGLVIQASSYRVSNGSNVQISVTNRDNNFAAISGTTVDTFRFNHSSTATVVRFDTFGACSSYIAVSQVGNIKCKVDISDPKTDVKGNLILFNEIPPNLNKMDVWAWTAADNTVYDNDIHSGLVKKITVETHG